MAGVMVLTCLLVPESGIAQTVFEKLVMPGLLIDGHAKLEQDCSNCHEPFSKKSQQRLCLACHKKITADRKSRRGLHGKRRDATVHQCKHCHTDHIGRKADIVGLDHETLNHDLTDFNLIGKHRVVGCSNCHKAGAKFRDASGSCVDCHKTIEPHLGRLGTNCATCHTNQAWRPIKKYDHEKTKFPLVLSHRNVKCKSCHAGERYVKLPSSCASCHDIGDVHFGQYGAKCETCHRPEKWQSVRFDHAKQTKFPLRGSHKKLKCQSCHTGNLYKVKLSTKCVACHKKDDPHNGQLGANCATCHNETKWRHKVLFDHDLTQFPLIGRHEKVKCAACHKTRNYKDAPKRCSSCHEDRYHAGRFGSTCGDCHSPTGWEFWRFDHNKRTNFPLTGRHKAAHCHSCHQDKKVQKASVPSTCYGCHQSDDVHRGSFGRSCERCHTTTSFKHATSR